MHKMPDHIEGFSQVEYLTVFTAIIFGVIASEFFNGWGNMIRHRGTVKIYWLHLAWTLFTFLTFVQNWYGNWPRTEEVNDGLLIFLWSLIPMFLFHAISVVLFPSTKNAADTDFKIFYLKNSRMLFILWGIYLVSTVLGPIIYRDVGDVTMQNMIRVGGIVLCALGAYFNRILWYHAFFIILMFGGLIRFILAIPT